MILRSFPAACRRGATALLFAALLAPIPAATLRAEELSARGAAADAPAAGNGAAAKGDSCLRERVVPIGAGPLQLGTQSYPQTLALEEREVVLTFDDGPAPDTTPAVLDALRDAKVHATFFLIGREAKAHPSLVRREVAEGHSVGHHSMTHPAITLRGLDGAAAERDIEDGIAADEHAAYGADASPENPRVRFFRFPGFADTPPLLNHLGERGIVVFGSDLWAADWLMMTPDAERARVLGLLRRRPHHNGIILFHDTKRQTARMLPALLADLCREGYRVAHLVPQPGAEAPPLFKPEHWRSQTEPILARMHLREEGRRESRRTSREAPDASVGPSTEAQPSPPAEARP